MPTWEATVRHSPLPLKTLDVQAATAAEARERVLALNLTEAHNRKQSGPALVRLIEEWAANGGLDTVEVVLVQEAPNPDVIDVDLAPQQSSGFAAVHVGGDMNSLVGKQQPARRAARNRGSKPTQVARESPPEPNEDPPIQVVV